MNNLLNKNEALNAALTQADLTHEDVRLLSCRLDGNFYEMYLCTDWMRYVCYVGAVSGELVGIDYEPVIDLDSLNGVSRAELLGMGDLAA